MTPTIAILEECKQLFNQAKERVADAMPMLHKIFTEKIYEGQYSSFGEYVDELGISRSYASRLIKVWEHYAIQGGVSQLNSDPDKLYLALSIPGSIEEKLAKAEVLTRNELREEASMKGDEEHTCEAISVCKTCWRRM